MSENTPYDAREVGNFILRLAARDGLALTQMTLLKILYFAHGWYLASFGIPLFGQPVEAWEHGPVVKVVRDAFKAFGKRPITAMAEKFDLSTGELVPLKSALDPMDENFVEGIYRVYSRYDAFTLSDLTHERGSPWDRVWNSREAVGRLGLRIRNSDIQQHFLALATQGVVH